MKVLKYERRGDPLLPLEHFVTRLLHTGGIALGIVLASLSLGILGYHYIQGLGWLDALLNASMILSGMGPVDPPKEPAGKLFASFYALFSGVVFITTAGILIAPVVHRLIHHFHIEKAENASAENAQTKPGHREKH
jgi:hypothetical protein